MPGLCVVLGVGCRWTEIQCSPVFRGNFTPSGHKVKVTSGHKVATMEGFTFVVRHVCFLNLHLLKADEPLSSAFVFVFGVFRGVGRGGGGVIRHLLTDSFN